MSKVHCAYLIDCLMFRFSVSDEDLLASGPIARPESLILVSFDEEENISTSKVWPNFLSQLAYTFAFTDLRHWTRRHR